MCEKDGEKERELKDIGVFAAHYKVLIGRRQIAGVVRLARIKPTVLTD